MPAPPPPSKVLSPPAKELFTHLENQSARTSLGPTRWPLLALVTLTGAGRPELASELYLYLTSQPAYQSPIQRQALVKRLREALVKAISLIGVCKPIEAIVAIASVEAEADRDLSPPIRENWACDAANHERAMEWFMKVYRHNATLNFGLFEAHREFDWISKEITYGLYLSGREVLDDIETELVVVGGIMVQNLWKETWWHIRGTRRVGVELEDMRVVYGCIEHVAQYCGVKLDRVPTVDEVEPDV
jgi:hypothetical protein